MESKLYKLEVKFSELNLKREQAPESFLLYINCGSISNVLKLQASVSLSLPSFSPDSLLELRLEENKVVVGMGCTVIGKLCEKTLTGDYSKWVKLENKLPQDLNLKIKIQGSLKNPRRTSPSKPRPGYLATSQKNKFKCLYIRKLNYAEEREKEIQGVIQRVKARMELNYGELIEDGIKSPAHAGRSPARSPLRKKTCERFSEVFDLEIPSRFDITMEQMSTNEPHLLRYVSIALSERIKVMRTQADEYISINEVISNFEDPIKDLTNSLMETKEQLMREDRKMAEFQKRVEEEILKIAEDSRIVQEKAENIELEIGTIKNLYESITKSNEELRFAEDLSELNSQVIQLSESLLKIDNDREDLLKTAEKIISKYDDDTEDNNRSKALDEKFQYTAQLQSKTSILDHLVIENLQLNGEIALLSAQLLGEEDAKERLSEIESHRETFSMASGSLQEDLDKLGELRENKIAEAGKLSKKLEIDVKDLASQCELLENAVDNKENEIGTQQEYVKKMEHANEETRKWIKQDEEEFQEKHSNFLEKYDADKNAKDLLVKELAFFSDLTLLHVSSSIVEERIHKKFEEILEEKDNQKHSIQRLLTNGSKKKPSSPRKENTPNRQ